MQQVVDMILQPGDALPPDEILGRIHQYIGSKRSVALDRVEFEECRQTVGESFDDYYIQLQRIDWVCGIVPHLLGLAHDDQTPLAFKIKKRVVSCWPRTPSRSSRRRSTYAEARSRHRQAHQCSRSRRPAEVSTRFNKDQNQRAETDPAADRATTRTHASGAVFRAIQRARHARHRAGPEITATS